MSQPFARRANLDSKLSKKKYKRHSLPTTGMQSYPGVQGLQALNPIGSPEGAASVQSTHSIRSIYSMNDSTVNSVASAGGNPGKRRNRSFVLFNKSKSMNARLKRPAKLEKPAKGAKLRSQKAQTKGTKGTKGVRLTKGKHQAEVKHYVNKKELSEMNSFLARLNGLNKALSQRSEIEPQLPYDKRNDPKTNSAPLLISRPVKHIKREKRDTRFQRRGQRKLSINRADQGPKRQPVDTSLVTSKRFESVSRRTPIDLSGALEESFADPSPCKHKIASAIRKEFYLQNKLNAIEHDPECCANKYEKDLCENCLAAHKQNQRTIMTITSTVAKEVEKYLDSSLADYTSNQQVSRGLLSQDVLASIAKEPDGSAESGSSSFEFQKLCRRLNEINGFGSLENTTGKTCPLSLSRFLFRLTNYMQIWYEKTNKGVSSHIGLACLFMSVSYLKELKEVYGLMLTKNNVFHTLLGCFLVSAKVSEHIPISTKWWADVGELSIDQLKDIELTIYKKKQFDMAIDLDHIAKMYQKYIPSLTQGNVQRFRMASVLPLSQSTSSSTSSKAERRGRAHSTMIATNLPVKKTLRAMSHVWEKSDSELQQLL